MRIQAYGAKRDKDFFYNAFFDFWKSKNGQFIFSALFTLAVDYIIYVRW